jgi:competence protein ComEC
VPPKIAGFDYQAYLAAHGIYSYMSFPGVKATGSERADLASQTLQPWRSNLSSALRRSVPEPAASLAVGVVIGDRTSMPAPIQVAFQDSGTTHVLAISGENIALITGFVWFLLTGKQQKRRPTVLVTLTLALSLVLYTAFTGAAPSIVRAAVMSCVLLFAPLARRRYDPVAALAISAFGMSLLDPRVLLDGGFELSFCAMLGIILLSPRIGATLMRMKCPRALAAALSTSIAAQIFTLPLGAWLTGRLSLVGLPATMVVDLALLPLMLTGMVTGALGTLAAPLAAITGLLVWLCGSWMISWVHMWSSVPLAAVSTDSMRPLWLAAYYGATAGVIGLATRQRMARFRLAFQRKPALAALAAAAALWVVFFGLVASR